MTFSSFRAEMLIPSALERCQQGVILIRCSCRHWWVIYREYRDQQIELRTMLNQRRRYSPPKYHSPLVLAAKGRRRPPTADEGNVFGFIEVVHSFEESEAILRRWGVSSETQ